MLEREDALWTEFAAESEEHLDGIEAVLTGAPPGREGVNALFRAFHSLKGMSDALGAQGLKTLAHAAEDVLGLVRAGRLSLDPPMADLLLRTVDTLRRQRRQLLGRQPELPADPALMAGLRRLAGGSAAPPPRPDPQPEPPPSSPASGDAADPLMATLASRCRAAVPLLAGLAGAAPGEAATGEAATAEAARREATALSEAAALLGLHRLSTGFAALAEAEAGIAALAALGGLRRQLERLSTLAGEPAGAEALPAALRDTPEHWMAPLLALLGSGAAPEELAGPARQAAAIAAALGRDALEQRLLVLEDLADRAAEPDAASALAEARGALLHARPDSVPAMAWPAPGMPEPGLPAMFLGVMGPEARRRALAARAAGQGLFLARLALGEDAALEERAGGWLRQKGEVLASQNPAGAEPPVLELLLASAAEPGSLTEQAALLDPERRVLREITPLPGTAPPETARSEEAEAAGPVTLRVRQETVDDIIALQAELSAAALSLSEVVREGGTRAAHGRLAALEALLPPHAAPRLAAELERLRQGQQALETAESRLGLALRRLDDAVMGLRVVPIGTLLARLPRVARAVAQGGGKQVEVVLEGQEVAIDRGLVEILSDPLLHLVRNAVDHGLEGPAARRAAGKPERGLLRIAARREGGEILVRVADDGAGIDTGRVLRRAVAQGLVEEAAAARLSLPETHALLFRPGFSTAERVTGTSGRGVGLDVVQAAVRRAGGTLAVESRPGEGTAFLLRLPLAASIQSVLLVEVAGHPYALPAARVQGVVETANLPAEAGRRSLATLLGLPEGPEGQAGVAVLVRSAGRLLALRVDRVRRRSDLLLRPLHPALANLPGVAGMGVLGDGEPVVLLEPEGF